MSSGESTHNDTRSHRTALFLGGGGARAAYQVGVLKAVAELVPKGCKNPFPIVCGTSAGSINTVALASNAANFHHGVRRIRKVWENFELHHVFHSDGKNLFKRIAHWAWSNLGPGTWYKGPSSLLDNQPLKELLSRYINFDKIDDSIKNGDLHAYCLTACSYTSGESTTFFDGAPEIDNWLRTHREGLREKMTIDHLKQNFNNWTSTRRKASVIKATQAPTHTRSNLGLRTRHSISKQSAVRHRAYGANESYSTGEHRF